MCVQKAEGHKIIRLWFEKDEGEDKKGSVYIFAKTNGTEKKWIYLKFVRDFESAEKSSDKKKNHIRHVFFLSDVVNSMVTYCDVSDSRLVSKLHTRTRKKKERTTSEFLAHPHKEQ
jgi:hypothetical protein